MTVQPDAMRVADDAYLAAEGKHAHRRGLLAALEAAAPLIAAASHRVWLEHVIGYQINGKLYHPSDVQIVLRGDEP